MGIRYTKSYNKEIRDAVRHFNSVRRTLSKRGIKITPQPMKVSELKARYQTRRELNKELELLNKLSSSNDKLLKEVENSGGVSSVKWEFEYLKLNQKKALEFYENEKRIEINSEPMFPGERMRLDEIEETIQVLNMNIDYMNQDQFKSFTSAIKDYLDMPGKQQSGYRGFLWQLENAMRIAGYENSSINSMFDKFKELTPSQFHELYRKNNLIKRIYQFVISEPHGNEMKLTVSEEDARAIIEAMKEEIDFDIASVK